MKTVELIECGAVLAFIVALVFWLSTISGCYHSHERVVSIPEQDAGISFADAAPIADDAGTEISPDDWLGTYDGPVTITACEDGMTRSNTLTMTVLLLDGDLIVDGLCYGMAMELLSPNEAVIQPTPCRMDRVASADVQRSGDALRFRGVVISGCGETHWTYEGRRR